MSQQKSRSRKRHQFWCHRRKSAPIWSLVLSTTDKIRQFWAENKLFSRKAHKNRFFVLYPLRDKKISFNPQFLAFLDGYPLSKKKILSKWFIFGPSRCLPDGREIFKTIHKNRVFVLYHLREKNIYGKGAVFDHPRCLPIEGRKIYFFKRLNFRFFSWSTPWGRKFRSRHNFWPLPVGKSEGIFKTGVKKLASRCLLFEGRKFFWEWLPKRPLSVGISEEKIIPWNPHISNFLAGYSLGEQNFFENTY